MSLTIGIVGLPNVGKSTLFNALTKNDVLAANYPFATIEPNVGVVGVPDPRLAKLAEIFGSASASCRRRWTSSTSPASCAARREGEGLGNKFLANIRETDAICQVIRAFHDPNVVHVDGKVSPKYDIETINTELILADLQTIEKALPRLEKESRLDKDKSKTSVVADVAKAQELLQGGTTLFAGAAAAGIDLDDLRELHLLTAKPFLYVFNVDEDELGDDTFKDEHARAGRPGRGDLPGREDRVGARPSCPTTRRSSCCSRSAQEESGLDQLAHVGFETLGLQTYLTAGPKESRAWTIPKGATAPEAAGVIHTDFQRGFIKAEVVSFDDLVDAGSMADAKSARQGPDRGQGLRDAGRRRRGVPLQRLIQDAPPVRSPSEVVSAGGADPATRYHRISHKRLWPDRRTDAHSGHATAGLRAGRGAGGLSRRKGDPCASSITAAQWRLQPSSSPSSSPLRRGRSSRPRTRHRRPSRSRTPAL